MTSVTAIINHIRHNATDERSVSFLRSMTHNNDGSILLLVCLFHQMDATRFVPLNDFMKASPLGMAATGKALGRLKKSGYIESKRRVALSRMGIRNVYDVFHAHLPDENVITEAFNQQHKERLLNGLGAGMVGDAKRQIMQALLENDGASRTRASVSDSLQDVRAFTRKVAELKSENMLCYPQRGHLQATESVWFPFGRPAV